jgi:hypothetical protein
MCTQNIFIFSFLNFHALAKTKTVRYAVHFLWFLLLLGMDPPFKWMRNHFQNTVANAFVMYVPYAYIDYFNNVVFV